MSAMAQAYMAWLFSQKNAGQKGFFDSDKQRTREEQQRKCDNVHTTVFNVLVLDVFCEWAEIVCAVSRTKHVWYSEHGTYYQFEIILGRVMSVTHVAVIPHMRTSPAYEEEFVKMDYPDVRNGYGLL